MLIFTKLLNILTYNQYWTELNCFSTNDLASKASESYAVQFILP
jgi:hypothetical protein